MTYAFILVLYLYGTIDMKIQPPVTYETDADCRAAATAFTELNNVRASVHCYKILKPNIN